ncbi:transcriptional regulator, HxlR family [Sinomicrobium oceani]|uniref:Transcriptional regulator, HxlR family n=1 Tax=Sinomicrobium oceani TaxID=1150368 RepID=A0A1K1M8W0_9FLAO|nr:helix-turn-helix domain-containing protein [Sinomicrobium oceani]SFW19602.1 transcriptional regulator, HxlR family [Sinomicrobium oceani]
MSAGGDHNKCENKDLLAVRDALEVLHGKWKLQILIAVLNGTKRFKEIGKEVEGISDRMLSKELKELEMNELVRRKVIDAFPPVVEYSATPHTRSLHPVVEALKVWGYLHRKKIIGGVEDRG